MTDNNESLRPEDFEPHRIEPDRRSAKANFADLWREKPLVRLIVILLPAVAVFFLIFGVLHHPKPVSAVSSVRGGSSVSQAPGIEGVSKEYKQAVEDVNKQRQDTALATGGSTIPTPVNATAAAAAPHPDVMATFTTPPSSTPPINMAVPTETPVSPTQQGSSPGGAPLAAPVPIAPRLDPQQIQALAAEMRTLLGSATTKAPTIIQTTHGDQTAQTVGQRPAETPVSAQPAAEREGRVIVPAGTVLYGQTLTEADSDIPAPVLVTVLSGPFTGCRAIGTFQKTNDYLVLAFGTIIKNTREYKVNALAIDPETTLSGLATDIDHHYFERFVLPAAAGFISGVGNYAQQAGSTVTNSTYGITQSYPSLSTHQEMLAGLGQSANAIAGVINQESNVQPTIYIDSGTPIGIMFVNSVRELANDR